MSCTERVKPGTVATLSCKSSYKLPVTNDPGYRTVTCLQNGEWDRYIFRCLPGDNNFVHSVLLDFDTAESQKNLEFCFLFINCTPS